MKVKLWEPCCSIAISEERYSQDWTVEVDEETSRRWPTVMADHHQVQEEMRQAVKDAHRRKY